MSSRGWHQNFKIMTKEDILSDNCLIAEFVGDEILLEELGNKHSVVKTKYIRIKHPKNDNLSFGIRSFINVTICNKFIFAIAKAYDHYLYVCEVRALKAKRKALRACNEVAVPYNYVRSNSTLFFY